MSKRVDFEIAHERGFYHPVGRMSFDEAVGRISDAITATVKGYGYDLLVNTTEMTGFPSPDALQRFYAAARFAAVAHGLRRLVMVARPEMIDPHKFGVKVAAHRGLECDIFTTVPEALAWLNSRNHSQHELADNSAVN